MSSWIRAWVYMFPVGIRASSRHDAYRKPCARIKAVHFADSVQNFPSRFVQSGMLFFPFHVRASYGTTYECGLHCDNAG